LGIRTIKKELCKHHTAKCGSHAHEGKGDGDSEDEEEDGQHSHQRPDPFLTFGFGVNSHFDILINLSCMFFVITIAFIPVYYGYYHSHAQALYSPQLINPIARLAVFSLGNLGSSTVVC